LDLEDTARQPRAFIHIAGIILFLFIPFVLFLFLRFPFGILLSFAAAITIMILHRFVAVPFMNRFRSVRCLFCGRTSRPMVRQLVKSGIEREFCFCRQECLSKAKQFFDFCSKYKLLFRIGIFIPLAWYVITMILNALGLLRFSVDWNRFIFQFCIACSVVAISFLYRTGKETDSPSFPFPIHNLFLLGIQNTLLVFRYVGLWWIAVSLIFLYYRL
jgi:hypothetical protein